MDRFGPAGLPTFWTGIARHQRTLSPSPFAGSECEMIISDRRHLMERLRGAGAIFTADQAASAAMIDACVTFLFRPVSAFDTVHFMQARQHVDSDGLHIVELSGEVDLHHAPELRSVLGAHAEAKRPALVVDVSGVEYMDSAGIATLIEYVQRSMAFGGRFALAGAKQRLHAIFEMVRLGEGFPIRPTIAEAKSALSA